MPRTVSANLKTHLAASVTTVSYLWKITRKDNTVFRFTDADKNIEYDSETYQSINSGSLSAIAQSANLAPDNFDYTVILNSSAIDKDDIIAGLFDYADVEIYLINRESPADGVITLIRGKFGQVKIIEDDKAFVEFRSLAQLLSQGIGRTYTHECDADLGDSRCGVTLASYTVTGTLTGVTDNQEFADSSRSEADDYFNYGVLTWTGGNNNGLSMEVKDFISSTGAFKLVSPMPFAVQVGDTYSVYKGCSKTKTACKSFGNILNFRGFGEVPGPDWLYTVPDVNDDAGLHE